MNDSMVEKGPSQLSTEINPSADASLAAADVAVSERFKGLVSEKAKQVARLVRNNVNNALLTIAGIGTILSAGCGNTEKVQPQMTPEPTQISAPFVPTINSDSETTILPMQIPEPISAQAEVPAFAPETASKPSPQTAEIQEAQEYSWQTIEGVKVAFDQDSLPVKYVLPDGQDLEIVLDREEMKKLKEKAISSKEAEVITILRINDVSIFSSTSNQISSSNLDRTYIGHTVSSELPKDTLSEEELAKRGVNIIQADSTHLYIREGAFAEGELLADFNNTGRKLNIVLVDSPMNSTYFMRDPRYNDFKKFFPEEQITIDEYRKSVLIFWKIT